MIRFVYISLILCVTFGYVYGQYQMPVYYATSYRPGQGGEEVGNAIDGNDATLYHSRYDLYAVPDTLTFYFNPNVPEINKIEYSPRKERYNGIWTKVDIMYSKRDKPDQFIRLNSDPIIWDLNNDVKSVNLDSALEHVFAIRIAVHEAYDDYSSCAEMRFYGTKPALPDGSIDCSLDASTLQGNKDVKIKIDEAGSSASSYQYYENIEKSFDGNFSTLYHSNYNAGQDAFPIDLVYHFSNKPVIDYFIYYPRSDGGYNGFFGATSIYYNTEESGPGAEYTHLLDYDFKMEGLPVRIAFPTSLKVNNVKIVVKNGASGFASCAEMEFYEKNGGDPNVFEYEQIFTDRLYTDLLPLVTQEMIDTISVPFYKQLASCLYAGTYNRSLRIRDFKAFESTGQLSDKLKTDRYDPYENATGILFEAGDKAVIFADGIGGSSVYLRVRNFANESNPADYLYLLNDGRNVIAMKDSGLAYLAYFSDKPAEVPAITVHIATGKINGYYDPILHNSNDWTTFLANSAYPKIDIVGRYAHLVFDKSALRQNSPFDGNHLIQLYDTIANWQKIQMGLYKFNYNYDNHILCESGTGGGWYAGGIGIHLDLTWGPASITNAHQLELWGIPHEFGHINQIRPGLRWIGTTEVTNNVYALWASYKLNKDGKRFTRLEEEAFPIGNDPKWWAGNRFNIYLDSNYIHGKALQDVANDYHFRVLVPFWQLQLYYQLAGACRNAPELTYEENPDVHGVDYPHWYGIVAEKVRNTNSESLTNGERLLNFVKYTCEAVQEDLSDFFINSGFLRPIDKEIDDYGVGRITVTQNQIDALVAQLRASFPNKPVSPVLHYISAHSMEMYKNKLSLSGRTGEGVDLIIVEDTPYLLIDHNEWKNAVAYETYDSTNTLIHVTITGTADVSNKTTSVLYADQSHKIYAIGYDGKKILVYPKEQSNAVGKNVSLHLKVFPNPTSDGRLVQVETGEAIEIYRMEIYDNRGRVVLSGKGNVDKLNHLLRKNLQIAPGAYFIKLTAKHSILSSSFTIQ